MDAAEVRSLRNEEITIELGRLREKLYALRVQSVTDKVEDSSQFPKVRRDIARLLTEQNARAAKQAEAPASA